MPRVPEYNEQFRYEGFQGSPRLSGMQVQTNADMFGAGQAKDLERLSHSLTRTARTAAWIYDDRSETQIMEAASTAQNQFMSWQAETAKRTGKDGTNAGADYDAWAKSQMQELTKKMDGMQRDRFMNMMHPRLSAQKRWAERHSSQQRDIYDLNTYQQSISSSTEELKQNISNPELSTLSLESIKQASFLTAQKKGLSMQDGVELTRKNIESAMVQAIQTQIQSGDLEQSKALIQNNKAMLSQPWLDTLNAQIKKTQQEQKDLPKWQKASQKHQEAQTKKQSLTDFESNFQAALDQNDFPKAATLLTTAPDEAKDYGQKLLELRSQGKQVQTDAKQAWKLKRLAIDDPKKFATEYKPTDYMLNLDKTTRDKFSEMKDKITENDEAYIQNAKAEQALMDETYTSLGISLHNPTEDDLQKASLVNAIYNQEVEAQSQNIGKPLGFVEKARVHKKIAYFMQIFESGPLNSIKNRISDWDGNIISEKDIVNTKKQENSSDPTNDWNGGINYNPTDKIVEEFFKENKSEQEYYILASRPLHLEADRFTGIVKIPTSITPRLVSHIQFFGSNGKNFGFFGDSKIRPDDNERIGDYKTIYNKKYNAKAIDAAIKIYKVKRGYSLGIYNCMDVKDDLLELAEHIAKEMNIPFILD